jgi:hypothetical protein
MKYILYTIYNREKKGRYGGSPYFTSIIFISLVISFDIYLIIEYNNFQIFGLNKYLKIILKKSFVIYLISMYAVIYYTLKCYNI